MKGFPWWGSVLLAIAAYYGLKYGTPKILPADTPLADLIPLFAPLSAMGFLLLAGKQLYDDEKETEHSEKNERDTPDENKE